MLLGVSEIFAIVPHDPPSNLQSPVPLGAVFVAVVPSDGWFFGGQMSGLDESFGGIVQNNL